MSVMLRVRLVYLVTSLVFGFLYGDLYQRLGGYRHVTKGFMDRVDLENDDAVLMGTISGIINASKIKVQSITPRTVQVIYSVLVLFIPNLFMFYVYATAYLLGFKIARQKELDRVKERQMRINNKNKEEVTI